MAVSLSPDPIAPSADGKTKRSHFRNDLTRNRLIADGCVTTGLEENMTNKQSFSPEDWTKILESVALSGVAVTAADPSGLMGLLKEVLCQRERGGFRKD